jgi:hypothetical protein
MGLSKRVVTMGTPPSVPKEDDDEFERRLEHDPRFWHVLSAPERLFVKEKASDWKI